MRACVLACHYGTGLILMPGQYYAVPVELAHRNDVSGDAKVLLGEITVLCSDKGYCWASNGYFADEYSVSERSVRRWLSELKDKGLVSVEFVKGQRRISVKGGTNLATPPDNSVLPPRTELSARYNRIYKLEYNSITELYNSTCVNLPPVRKITDARKKAIEKFADTFGEDAFSELFNKAAGSAFLNGNGKSGWRASFDWLVDTENAVKVLEGQYDGGGCDAPSAGTVDDAAEKARQKQSQKEFFENIRRNGRRNYEHKQQQQQR